MSTFTPNELTYLSEQRIDAGRGAGGSTRLVRPKEFPSLIGG